jgi:hypothetical protein
MPSKFPNEYFEARFRLIDMRRFTAIFGEYEK